MIRFLTAGESHGTSLVGILEGMPAGLVITEQEMDVDLRRRQLGYGRGARMAIEEDHVKILAGVRYGKTLGSPIALSIENRDGPNWRNAMRMDEPPLVEQSDPLTAPRPGHADYAGAVKYRHDDLRNVIERASARETAMRVALGAVCRKFLREFGIQAGSHVVSIGSVHSRSAKKIIGADELNMHADQSAVRCLDSEASNKMVATIDHAKAHGDTLGGSFEIVVSGVPVGLGSCMSPDRRLDAILAAAVMSIPAVKSVGFGMGEEVADRFGSEVHDRMFPGDSGIMRKTNHAGGIEGGMSNGEPLVIRAAMKPLSSLTQPLETVDLRTGAAATALSERSDVCAVPSASVIGEAVCLLALMSPFLEKFGGDSMAEIRDHISASVTSPCR